jgi:hypothetical protein
MKEIGRHQGRYQMASKSVLHQLLWCFQLFPSPSASSAMKTTENRKEADNREPVDEQGIQMKYFSD